MKEKGTYENPYKSYNDFIFNTPNVGDEVKFIKTDKVESHSQLFIEEKGIQKDTVYEIKYKSKLQDGRDVIVVTEDGTGPYMLASQFQIVSKCSTTLIR